MTNFDEILRAYSKRTFLFSIMLLSLLAVDALQNRTFSRFELSSYLLCFAIMIVALKIILAFGYLTVLQNKKYTGSKLFLAFVIVGLVFSALIVGIPALDAIAI